MSGCYSPPNVADGPDYRHSEELAEQWRNNLKNQMKNHPPGRPPSPHYPAPPQNPPPPSKNSSYFPGDNDETYGYGGYPTYNAEDDNPEYYPAPAPPKGKTQTPTQKAPIIYYPYPADNDADYYDYGGAPTEPEGNDTGGAADYPLFFD